MSPSSSRHIRARRSLCCCCLFLIFHYLEWEIRELNCWFVTGGTAAATGSSLGVRCCLIALLSLIHTYFFLCPKQRWCFMPSQQSIARHTPFNLWAQMNRGQSASARLGRVSEESAEFFERVNAVLQKQENMLRAAQAEVTPNPPSTFPSARHLTPRLPAGLMRLRLASPAAPGSSEGSDTAVAGVRQSWPRPRGCNTRCNVRLLLVFQRGTVLVAVARRACIL